MPAARVSSSVLSVSELTGGIYGHPSDNLLRQHSSHSLHVNDCPHGWHHRRLQTNGSTGNELFQLTFFCKNERCRSWKKWSSLISTKKCTNSDISLPYSRRFLLAFALQSWSSQIIDPFDVGNNRGHRM